jgi:hypothetical protein
VSRANRLEAVQPALFQSVTTCLMPMINQMTVAGLVTIPGMMTGQVLAGQDPLQASRYQVMIIYLISAGSQLSLFIVIALSAQRVLDRAGRLRLDRIRKAGASDKPANGAASLSKVEVQQGKNAVRRAVVRQGARSAPGGRVVLSVPMLEVTAGGRTLFTVKDLEICEGEVCAVMGPSGSGKSSLLSALAVTLPPDMVSGTSRYVRRTHTHASTRASTPTPTHVHTHTHTHSHTHTHTHTHTLTHTYMHARARFTGSCWAVKSFPSLAVQDGGQSASLCHSRYPRSKARHAPHGSSRC